MLARWNGLEINYFYDGHCGKKIINTSAPEHPNYYGDISDILKGYFRYRNPRSPISYDNGEILGGMPIKNPWWDKLDGQEEVVPCLWLADSYRGTYRQQFENWQCIGCLSNLMEELHERPLEVIEDNQVYDKAAVDYETQLMRLKLAQLYGKGH